MGDLREEQVALIARALLASAIKGDLAQQRVLTRRLIELAPEAWTKVRYNTAAFVVDDSFRAEVEALLRGVVVAQGRAVHHGVVASLAATIGFTAQPFDRDGFGGGDWRSWMSLPPDTPSPEVKLDAVREAIGLLDDAVDNALQAGDPAAAALHAGLMADMSGCVDLERSAIDACRRVLQAGPSGDTPNLEWQLACALQRSGDVAAALEHFERVIGLHASASARPYPVWSHLRVGSILLARGDAAGAEAHLDAALSLIRVATGFRHPPPTSLARDLARAGRKEAALRFCSELEARGFAGPEAKALLEELQKR